jgi:hypothetical protein
MKAAPEFNSGAAHDFTMMTKSWASFEVTSIK